MSHNALHDRDDIKRIWQEYSVSLKGFLRSKVSQEADVEDLLQEILLKTHQNIASLKAKEKLKPWLFQVAHHAVIDLYRRQGRVKQLEAKDLWYQDELDGQENLAHQSEGLAGLEECITPFVNALPKASAELLQQIDILGRSQKLYAHELGISYSTLKSRVQKARVELKGLFEACCYLQLDAQGNVMEFVPRSNKCKGC